jgi:CrcB protein
MLLIYLALGGALGTILRYALGGWVHSWAGVGFPWGTLAVNVAGSFVLGVTMRASQSLLLSPELRAFITIGLCGAFTTFSTYSYEAFVLMQKGDWTKAALYAFGSLVIGVVAIAAGFIAAARVLRPGG